MNRTANNESAKLMPCKTGSRKTICQCELSLTDWLLAWPSLSCGQIWPDLPTSNGQRLLCDVAKSESIWTVDWGLLDGCQCEIYLCRQTNTEIWLHVMSGTLLYHTLPTPLHEEVLRMSIKRQGFQGPDDLQHTHPKVIAQEPYPNVAGYSGWSVKVLAQLCQALQ